MTIFSEIYGAYYRIAARAMRKKSVTDDEVYELIRSLGFRDSALFLPQKLLPQKDGSDWGLLRRNVDGTLSRVTENPPPAVLTLLQKRWLKSKLADDRFRLFFDDETLRRLEERLADIKPLYRRAPFRYFDKFTDGDDYADPQYRENFRVILSAIKSRELLKIAYVSGHDKRICFTCLPLNIEYSEKNDKLRVLTRRHRNGRISSGGVINLGRIDAIERTGRLFTGELNAPFQTIKQGIGRIVLSYIVSNKVLIKAFLWLCLRLE